MRVLHAHEGKYNPNLSLCVIHHLCMAAEMSDHEGFEMLDETFGVREASEASDSETCPNSPLQLARAGSLDDDDHHHLHSSGGGMAAGGRSDRWHATPVPGEGTVPETGVNFYWRVDLVEDRIDRYPRHPSAHKKWASSPAA